ncbi:hypothetical protein [Paenibacillus polymyxa]|uniref:hypothetical protein n=1 Tax=Paenibacillus polymyxa TaxID=1406 RepID=UPI003D2C7DF3
MEHSVHIEKLYEKIYDENDNLIREDFLEDYRSITLKIKNISSRPISILFIRHDSDFEFNDEDEPYHKVSYDCQGKLLSPGAVYTVEKAIDISLQTKEINYIIETTYYVYKGKITIGHN